MTEVYGFRTPRGQVVAMTIRDGTNDWNTANSCLNEDEYRIRGLHLTGTALDIGGYSGAETIALLVDNPELHVITLEPLPPNLELIRENLKYNGVADRCTLIAGAIGHGSITIHYGYSDTESNRHHRFVGNAYGAITYGGGGPHETVTYEATSFKDLAGDLTPSFVKIDCEGGLWAVLPEMTGVPIIAGEAEPVPLPDGTKGSRAVLESILGPTHDIEWGAEPNQPGDWGFWAVRR
jgi:FkbM family methyltransferase